MTIVRSAKYCAAIAAAFTGLSLSVAYAAPAYAPLDLSPIDATTLDSVSPQLNDFNQYLIAIDAKLPAGKTLAFPDRKPDSPIGAPEKLAATDLEIVLAVAAAVDAAVSDTPTPAEIATAQGIVSAAVQFKPGKVRDILRNVAALVPAVAPDVVSAASVAVPLRAPDAASGAILGLVAYSAALVAEVPAQDPLEPSVYATTAQAAVIAQTRDLIERVAKAAVSSTKRSTNVAADATAVAKAIMDTFMADAVGSNAELYIDDLARGAVSGIHGFPTITKAFLASELVKKLAVPVDPMNLAAGLQPAPGVTKEQVVNFAMGAMKSAAVLGGTAGSTYDEVSAAVIAAAAAIDTDSTSPVFTNISQEIQTGAMIQKELRLSPATAMQIFSDKLTAAEAPYLASYVSGAVQAMKGRAADWVKLAFEDAEVNAGTQPTVAQRQAVVAAAITGNFAATGKAVTYAINNGSSNNIKLTAVEAIQAAIPAATEMFSGAAVLSAMRTVAVGGTEQADAENILVAGLNAANAANYQSAFGDIAFNAARAKRLLDNALIAKAVETVPSGWEEAVAVAMIAINPKDAPATPGGPTNKTSAIDAANAKSAAVGASVTLAVNITIAGKASPRTVYDDAIEAIYANPDKARAVLFGAGVVNARFAVPLMSMLFRLKDGGDSREVLRDYAISLNKRAKLNIQLGYEAASDAVDSPDDIFNLVDHKVLTNPRYLVDIVSAVVAARPEYAHYAARAAAFRAPNQVGRSAIAAIQFAHMRANRDLSGNALSNPDDPAAVAAISAATVLGVKDAKLPTPLREEAAIKAAIAGLVKAAYGFQNPTFGALDPDKRAGLVGNTADFPEATGLGTDVGTHFTLRRSKGTAAVLTGAIAQLQVDDTATPANELIKLTGLSKVAITAAAKAAKLHSLALAQAAGAAAAAAAIAGGGDAFDDFIGIAKAFAGIVGVATEDRLKAAAEFGANQVLAGQYGPGAAGILNYGHVSGGGAPVTHLSNF